MLVERFVGRIAEELGELDPDRQGHRRQAAGALAVRAALDRAGGEDPLVQRLELHVDVEPGSLLHRDEALAQVLGGREVERPLAHLTRVADQVAHVHDVGVAGGHGR